MTRRRITGLLVVTVLVLASGRVFAEESPLSIVPDNALGFVTIQDITKASEKLEKVVHLFSTDIPPLLDSFKGHLGVDHGLNVEGDMLLALLPGEDKPQPLLALPVSDYDGFIKQLAGDPSKKIAEVTVAERSIFVAHKGDYAVFVDADNRKTLQNVIDADGKTQSTITSMSDWLSRNDVAVVVLSPGLKVGVEKGLEGLQEMRNMFTQMAAESEQGAQMLAGLDMYVKALEFCGTEVQTVALGLHIDDHGNLDLGGRVRIVSGGKLAEMVAGAPLVIERPLADIPDSPFVACASTVWKPEWSKPMMRWSIDMMKLNGAMYGIEDVSEEDMQELLEASEAIMKPMRSASVYMSPGEPDAPFYSDLYYIFQMDDASTYLADYEKYLTVWNNMVGGDDGAAMKFDVEHVKLHDLDALKLSMDLNAMMAQQAAGNPQAQAMMQQMMGLMFGPEGKMTMYLVATDKTTVMMGVATQEQMEAAVKSCREGGSRLVDNKHVEKTASLLPKDAAVVGYLSPQGSIAWFQRTFARMIPVAGLQQLPEFPETPSIGFSAGLSGLTLKTELVVPAETVKGLSEFVRTLNQ